MTQNKPRGLLGGLVKGVGGAGGAAMSDAMTINQRLTREGINLSDMQAILPGRHGLCAREGRWARSAARGAALHPRPRPADDGAGVIRPC